jgi:hypothetical protein
MIRYRYGISRPILCYIDPVSVLPYYLRSEPSYPDKNSASMISAAVLILQSLFCVELLLLGEKCFPQPDILRSDLEDLIFANDA